MTAERWTEVCAVFSSVLNKEPNDRASYLLNILGHDPDLRDKVSQLLRDFQEAEKSSFLAVPAWVIDNIPRFLPNFRNGASEFTNIEYIGHGGMGVVYKAYQSNFDRWVAIKLCTAHLTRSSDVERFRSEAQSMARLRHQNVVTVHETGEYDGRPYFVMELIAGEPLSERASEFRDQPREAAAIVEQIALAVHHAHQRRVLHNDLKPANVLLDEDGKPHVTDFGLARHFEDEAAVSPGSCTLEGTASFMSPEQAEGKELTTASDVYGLGAILYSLLTGSPPFSSASVWETLQQVRSQKPKPPRLLNSKVDPTLEAICLKCLRKDKSGRYASANSLAMDIGRYLSGRETLALPWKRHERILGWCRRSRMEAGLAAAVAAIWIFAVIMALSIAEARKKSLLEGTLRSVDFAARDLAATALLQLRTLSKSIEIATADERLADLVSNRKFEGLQSILDEICHGQPDPFATCYVVDAQGIMVAHSPPSTTIANNILGLDSSWRDYFEGAKRLADAGPDRKVYVARVYRGRSDNKYKFAIAAPILDRSNRFLGVIATAVATDATLGQVFPRDSTRQSSIIAPSDRESPESPAENKYVVVFHPAFHAGVDVVEVPESSRAGMNLRSLNTQNGQIDSSNILIPPDDNYIDPVSRIVKEYAGRWIAGFAPIGNTGFLVVVQQRFDKAVTIEASTFWRLTLYSALVSLVAIAIIGIALWQWTRSQKLERCQS